MNSVKVKNLSDTLRDFFPNFSYIIGLGSSIKLCYGNLRDRNGDFEDWFEDREMEKTGYWPHNNER